jgi:hypothetical protein
MCSYRRMFVVEVDLATATVDHLRGLIHVTTGIEPEFQVLEFRNKTLAPEAGPGLLTAVGIGKKSLVYLSGRVNGVLKTWEVPKEGAPRDAPAVLEIDFPEKLSGAAVPRGPLVVHVPADQPFPDGPALVEALVAHLGRVGIVLSADPCTFFAVLHSGNAEGRLLDMGAPEFGAALASAFDVDPRVTLGVCRSVAEAKVTFQVCVTNLTGKTLVLDVAPPTTLGDLKTLIQVKEGIAADLMRLVFRGRQLDEDRRTLHSYGIRANANLNLLLRLRGGFDAGASISQGTLLKFASMHPRDAVKSPVAYADPGTPAWKTVASGLNLTGTCDFAECPSRAGDTGKVCIPLRFGVFEVGRLMTPGAVRCPACAGAGRVALDRSPRVHNTVLVVVGRRAGDPDALTDPQAAKQVVVVNKEEVVTFNAKPADGTDGPGATVAWDSLTLIALPDTATDAFAGMYCDVSGVAIASRAAVAGQEFGDALAKFNVWACEGPKTPKAPV